MEKYAYIRVSTREQNEARQLIAMLAQERGVDIVVLDMPVSTFRHRAARFRDSK